MQARTTLTVRQQRLGSELRKLRERAGLSSTDAASLLGGPQSRISNIEAGRYAVSADRVRTMARNYACTDEAYAEALASMTGARTHGWWDEYQELLPPAMVDIAELENQAVSLRVAVVIHMPGLLQTTAHARAVMAESVPPMRQHEVEHRVSYRIKRQAVLYKDTPMPYTAVVHEAALRMGIGGHGVARDQLAHLLEVSERDNITLLVVPFGEASFPASGQPISYASGLVPQLDTVVLDSDHTCAFLDAEAQLVRYRAVLDRMEARALSPGQTRDLIRRTAQNH